MIDLLARWESGDLSSAEVMAEIGERLKSADEQNKNDLFELSARILDAEVPLAETDLDADERWWNQHHPTDDA